MAYETFERKAFRAVTPVIAVVPDGRIALNAAATRILEEAGIKAVKILWDKTTSGIALQAAPKDHKDSYSLALAKGYGSATITAKTFFRHIGWSAAVRQVVPTTWNAQQKMLEARLPSEFVGSVDQRATSKLLKQKK